MVGKFDSRKSGYKILSKLFSSQENSTTAKRSHRKSRRDRRLYDEDLNWTYGIFYTGDTWLLMCWIHTCECEAYLRIGGETLPELAIFRGGSYVSRWRHIQERDSFHLRGWCIYAFTQPRYQHRKEHFSLTFIKVFAWNEKMKYLVCRNSLFRFLILKYTISI